MYIFLLLTTALFKSRKWLNGVTSSPRSTIAHLRVNKYSHWTKCVFFFCFFEDLIKIEDAGVATTLKIKHSRAANSAVQGRIWLKFELIQDVMVILVSSKNEEDPIKIEGARVVTTQNNDFSNTQGQLTPQSEVGSGRNSNSSEIL